MVAKTVAQDPPTAQRRPRLRLEAANNVVTMDRNPNTGHTLGMDAELKTANQAVYHDREHPSHILLPIIPAHGGH